MTFHCVSDLLENQVAGTTAMYRIRLTRSDEVGVMIQVHLQHGHRYETNS
jgi:hypothetical protein